MELKEYIQIIKKSIKLFFLVTGLIIIVIFLYFFFRPTTYSTSLTLNITRSSAQNTADYKYDDFYRIQADEKFAETVVQWLKSPRVIANILKEAGINSQNLSLGKLGKIVKSEKMSSQVVFVTYSTPDQKTADSMARSIQKIVSQNTENLNKNQKEDSWFEVVAHDPITKKDVFNPGIIFIISLAVGVFIAFWVVMMKHYISDSNVPNKESHSNHSSDNS